MITLGPGQMIVGRKQLAADLGMTEKQVRLALDLLVKCENISVKGAKTHTLVTVANWALYQDQHVSEATKKADAGPRQGQDRATNKNKSIRTQKKKILFVEGDEPLRLATYLFNCIRNNLPEFKPPDLQTWARHVDYMLRIDKREVEQVRRVIAWAQSDNQPRGDSNFCWASNILSTSKLREKFDQLAMKMAAGHGKKDEFVEWAEEQRQREGRSKEDPVRDQRAVH